ncbi:hypothetical protein GCM10009682_37600 [Luedemannella flava]|uniref:Uncharacterized protein n=1 Tax=Luedemannella flava TaxID=349316 RepID=A0ABP4YE14_9ACTN
MSSYLAFSGWAGPTTGVSYRSDIRRDRAGVDDAGQPQRAPEGASPLRLREAGQIGMQMSTATRQPASLVGHEPPRGRPDRDPVA